MFERTRELGIARAIGVRRGVLGRIVILEALVLGLLGFGLAVALGLSLGTLWVKATFPALLGWTLSLHVPTLQLLGIGAATLAVSLLAAYLPAVRAVRLDPVPALREE